MMKKDEKMRWWMVFVGLLTQVLGDCQPVIKSASGNEEYSYNLSPLANNIDPYTVFLNEVDVHTIFYVSFCQSKIGSSMTCEKLPDKEQALVVSVDLKSCTGWAKADTEQFWTFINPDDPQLGIQTKYSFPGTGPCKERTATYILYCKMDATSTNIDVLNRLETDGHQCDVKITFTTSLACPTVVPVGGGGTVVTGGGGGGGGGTTPVTSSSSGHSFFGTLFIIILVGFGLYCCVGFGLGVREGKVGVDAIPHVEFWQAVPSIISEVCSMIVTKIMTLINGANISGSTRTSDFAAPQHHPDAGGPSTSTSGSGNYTVI